MHRWLWIALGIVAAAALVLANLFARWLSEQGRALDEDSYDFGL